MSMVEGMHRGLQGVWASKYNERALLSMRKVGLDFRDLRMAVLVQRVVPAAYAFVIHTHNPSTGAEDEIYAEVVPLPLLLTSPLKLQALCRSVMPLVRCRSFKPSAGCMLRGFLDRNC